MKTAVALHGFLTWIRDGSVGCFQKNIDVSGGSCLWFAGLLAPRSRRMAMNSNDDPNKSRTSLTTSCRDCYLHDSDHSVRASQLQCNLFRKCARFTAYVCEMQATCPVFAPMKRPSHCLGVLTWVLSSTSCEVSMLVRNSWQKHVTVKAQ